MKICMEILLARTMDLTSTFASSFVCHSAAGRARLDAENAYKLQHVCWDRVINGTAHIINNNYYFFFVRVCEFGIFANDGEFAARQSISDALRSDVQRTQRSIKALYLTLASHTMSAPICASIIWHIYFFPECPRNVSHKRSHSSSTMCNVDAYTITHGHKCGYYYSVSCVQHRYNAHAHIQSWKQRMLGK